MKDKDYHKLISLAYVGGGFIPANEQAEELTETLSSGQVLQFLEVTDRDLNLHRCYFSILNFVYVYLPKKFKNAVKCADFYKFLKHIKGDYDVVFTFQDGSKMIEYKSISFGKMSNERFRNYIKEQMPFIYENLVHKFFTQQIAENIIATIEMEYERFFVKYKI